MKRPTILGARPPFIKAATVSRAIRANNAAAQAGGQGNPMEEVIAGKNRTRPGYLRNALSRPTKSWPML